MTMPITAEVTTASQELSAFMDTIKTALADMTASNLGTILVAGLGITIALVLAWFAYRWLTRKLSGAMKSGKLG